MSIKKKKTDTKAVVKKTKKSNTDKSEELAVSCCAILKKSMASGVYTDWEQVGYDANSTRWLQIKGLMNGNNIVISVSIEGRKKKYRLSVLSLQGTEIECEFTTFSYTHRNHILVITFASESATVTHKVSYGD